MDVNSFVIGYNKGKASAPAGVELNIHYSETEPPKDTSKLWVKTSEPSAVVVSKAVDIRSARGITELTEKLPYAEYERGRSVTIGDKIYIFSGQYYYNRMDSILRFDPATGKIEVLEETLPEKRMPAAVVAIGTKVYLFGGATNANKSTSIWCYDMENGSIELLDATLEYYDEVLAAGACGSKIYLMGGYPGGNRYDILCFDAENESTETIKSQLPLNIACTTFASVGTNLYLFGGFYSSTLYNLIVRFDAEKEEVQQMEAIVPNPSFNTVASAIGNKIYLFGGSKQWEIANETKTCVKTIWCYDTVNDKIEVLEETLPVEQVVATASSVGNSVYLFGGKIAGYSNNARTGIYRFDEEVISLTKDVLQIVPTEEKNNFQLLNSPKAKMEIGIDKAYKGNDDNEAEIVATSLYENGTWKSV